MTAMAVPLAADKLAAWEAWVAELKGPRQAGFEDMNARLGLTKHEAYLQPTPDGNFLTVVVAEGTGSSTFIANVLSSDHEFDQWFARSIADLHGMDVAGPVPPMPTRKL